MSSSVAAATTTTTSSMASYQATSTATSTTTTTTRTASAAMYSASSTSTTGTPAAALTPASPVAGMLPPSAVRALANTPGSPALALGANNSNMVPASPAMLSSSTTAALHGSSPSLLLQYQLALIFFKKERNNGKITYNQNNRLGALTKQASYGSYEVAKPYEPGFFDLVGKDKKAAWVALGNMTGEEAMETFLKELSEAYPEFEGWMKERLFEQLEQERRERERREQEQREREFLERERQLRIQRQEAERVRLEQERIERLQREQQALREQQAAQQRLLLQQQQEQQQALLQQQQQQQKQLEQQQREASAAAHAAAASQANGDGYNLEGVHVPKSKYTTPEFLAAFIQATKGKADSELLISRGELVTVRVPKPKAGSVQVLWEFCTEDYDISFGLEFEKQAEEGVAPTVQAILPVMRVNSNVHVIAGSHTTSDVGCWLLKFDNTYSYLRSKTVLYRVFCKPV